MVSAATTAPDVVEHRPADDVRNTIRCTYVTHFDGDRYTLFPDGCVDLVCDGEGVLRICGPETTGWSFRLAAGTEWAGVRLQPGAFSQLFGPAACEIVNAQIRLDEVLSSRVARTMTARIGEAQSCDQRRVELDNLVRSAMRSKDFRDDAPPVAKALATSPRSADLATIACEFGVSRRQLHREAVRAVGYGPSMFRRILRIQDALALLQGSQATLACIAACAGFADQPHMTREFRAICRTTPARARLPRRSGGSGVDVHCD